MGTTGGATLTLFCGLPGAGKTTLAKRLEAEGRGVRLCTDEWQAELGLAPTDVGFHDRLQVVLYRHALGLLRRGTDVILEDGLWTAAERADKFADARRYGARLDFHVFDVPLATLWSRLQTRNRQREFGAYPMTYPELERAWAVFERPAADEMSAVENVTIHAASDDDEFR